jgi:hypothetical protein
MRRLQSDALFARWMGALYFVNHLQDGFTSTHAWVYIYTRMRTLQSDALRSVRIRGFVFCKPFARWVYLYTRVRTLQIDLLLARWMGALYFVKHMQDGSTNTHAWYRAMRLEIASKYPHNVAQARGPKIRPILGTRCRLQITRPRNPRFKDAHAGTKRRLKAKTINRDAGISGTARNSMSFWTRACTEENTPKRWTRRAALVAPFLTWVSLKSPCVWRMMHMRRHGVCLEKNIHERWIEWRILQRCSSKSDNKKGQCMWYAHLSWFVTSCTWTGPPWHSRNINVVGHASNRGPGVPEWKRNGWNARTW